MQRTNFAGLTELAPDDPLTIDDAAFLRRNIRTIDRFIAIGAKTHHHDGHAPIASPVGAPGVVAGASSGSIDANTLGYFGVSLLDVDGGETLVSPLASARTPQTFTPPVVAPSATADYTAGTLRADTYYYGVTLVDGVGGETTIGPARTVNRAPGYASGRVIITALDQMVAASSGAVGWAIYRATAGGQWAYLASGSMTQYIDSGQDCADCLRMPPTYNTTRKTGRFDVTLPASGAIPQGATTIRLYGGTDPDFPDPALVGSYPLASAGATVPVLSMALAQGSPPKVSGSVGGATPINPQTEIATPVSTLVPAASAFQAAGGSGWATPSVALMAGLIDLEGAFVGSGAIGDPIGLVPAGYRPRAKYPVHGTVVASGRGRVAVDALPDGRLVLAEALAGVGASAAVFLSGRWRV